MSKDATPPTMVPFNVVGILREKLRQRDAAIAALEAKTQGQAVEIAQLRAALQGRGSAQAVEIQRAD
jgi:hypothetical protein